MFKVYIKSKINIYSVIKFNNLFITNINIISIISIINFIYK